MRNVFASMVNSLEKAITENLLTKAVNNPVVVRKTNSHSSSIGRAYIRTSSGLVVPANEYYLDEYRGDRGTTK
jgi:hypothetical protein